MDRLPLDFTPLRFSSDDLPERDRAAALRDFFAPRVFGGEVEPLSGRPLECHMEVRRLPGLSLVSAFNSPLRFSRTPALLADGNDDYGLHLNSQGCTVSQHGRELTCGPGDAALVNVGEAGTTIAPIASHFVCLNISRAALAPFVPDAERAVLRPIAPSEPLRYLISYLRFLESEDMSADPNLVQTAATHLRDLFALVLGANREATFVAEARGLRAARLAAIKRFIDGNLARDTLDVNAVATRHGLTPRTVQRLFEREGTTFSEYLLGRRLTKAYRMLTDAGHADWTVSAIALEAGFGDLSYFNRCFRRRFGAPPSWLRGA
jgi:AraC-like DNA-binding protein